MANFERGTKLVATITNGISTDLIRITADGDQVCDERSAKNCVRRFLNNEWSVIKVEVAK